MTSTTARWAAAQLDIEARLVDDPIVAILRGLAPDPCRSMVDELQGAGLRSIEVTIQDDEGFAALQAVLQHRGPGAHAIGAGSVINATLVHQAVDAGAEFLVCPGISVEVVAASKDRGIPIFPGVATPSEVQLAASLGLRAVKVFPATQLGGPAYLRALQGPFPNMRFIPTGGVSFKNADEYLRAGALAVGIGGELTQPGGAQALRTWITNRHHPSSDPPAQSQ